jgi:predicted O-methyltransferase YrrM
METVSTSSEILWQAARAVAAHFSDHYAASPEQQRALFDEVLKLGEGDWVVELGVCNGNTAAVLCSAANDVGAQYIGIDHFGLENDAPTVRRLFAENGLHGSIWNCDTHVAGRVWEAPISLLFIDAGHDEANVKLDIKLWVKWVKPGGVVAFHDWDEPYNPTSPHWAIHYYGLKAMEGWTWIPCPVGMAMFKRSL